MHDEKCPKCGHYAVTLFDCPTSDGGTEDSMVCQRCLSTWSLSTWNDFREDIDYDDDLIDELIAEEDRALEELLARRHPDTLEYEMEEF